MKNKILKILVCSLILLIGIGAVNALDNNSTDEFISFEQDEVNFNDEHIEVLSNVNADEGISDNNSEVEVLSAENTNVSDNCDEIFCSQIDDGNQIVAIDDEVLSTDNGNEDILASSNDDEVLSAVVENETEVLGSSEPPSDATAVVDVTHSSNLHLIDDGYNGYYTKEFVYAKVKFSKKNFKRFFLKTPSKKNKKLWKKYKRFQKKFMKKYNKSKKKRIKAIKKKWKIDWYYGIRHVFVVKGKYCTVNSVCLCYRGVYRDY